MKMKRKLCYSEIHASVRDQIRPTTIFHIFRYLNTNLENGVDGSQVGQFSIQSIWL